MSKILEIGLIILAAISVGVADVLIREEAVSANTLLKAIENPLTILIILLYGIQILVFSFLFVQKAQLGIVGIMQTALYAVIIIASGILFFREKITLIHMIGVSCGLLGAILMNL